MRFTRLGGISKEKCFAGNLKNCASSVPICGSGGLPCLWKPPSGHFAQDVVEECAAFPFGEHDDYVDSTTQAIMRIRQGGMVRHPEDYKEEPLVKGEIKYYG